MVKVLTIEGVDGGPSHKPGRFEPKEMATSLFWHFFLNLVVGVWSLQLLFDGAEVVVSGSQVLYCI